MQVSVSEKVIGAANELVIMEVKPVEGTICDKLSKLGY
uniref:Uncharacterized protein n=1 Tax=Anguilla anguilla TaxID=7936 RepID=A0A0E9Q609_ANGAN